MVKLFSLKVFKRKQTCSYLTDGITQSNDCNRCERISYQLPAVQNQTVAYQYPRRTNYHSRGAFFVEATVFSLDNIPG